MIHEYPVYFAEESIGTAAVQRQGLFYKIRCLCRLSGSVPFQLTVRAEKEVDLGLCVPMGDAFGVETQIPIKRVGEGALCFRVQTKHRDITEEFIAISPEEPFLYLAKLKDAYMVRRADKAGIAFSLTGQFPNQPDSGQNP